MMEASGCIHEIDVTLQRHCRRDVHGLALMCSSPCPNESSNVCDSITFSRGSTLAELTQLLQIECKAVE